jgi:hypothetical protein
MNYDNVTQTGTHLVQDFLNLIPKDQLTLVSLKYFDSPRAAMEFAFTFPEELFRTSSCLDGTSDTTIYQIQCSRSK